MTRLPLRCFTLLTLALAGTAPAQQAPELSLPPGFRAVLAHPGAGAARHIAIGEPGTLYVALRSARDGGGTALLRDTDADGLYDAAERLDTPAGTGVLVHGGFLYRAPDDQVLRYPLGPDGRPTGPGEVIVRDLPGGHGHAAKSIAIVAGRLAVNVGAPSNACQDPQRTRGVPGQQPCPELESSGGVWMYDPSTPEQRHPQDGERLSTGLRNCVALAGRERDGAFYTVVHGRDQLDSLWPEHFDAQDNAELPAEEFHRLLPGTNAGWPYTYWDPRRGQRMVAPEYGGDGQTISENPALADPIQSFPAHWAPNGLVFYEGQMFPERFRGGAFVAFHGSWNRAPFPQAGYRVTFSPFVDGAPAGDWEPFADGFAGSPEIRSPREAQARPMGLAVDHDGSLLIADSVRGRVWRIIYEGNAPEPTP